MYKQIFMVFSLFFILNGQIFAQRPAQKNYPPDLPGSKEITYKTVGETTLKLYMYTPKDHSPNQPRMAVVFFFGGGWSSGTPKQFEQQCLTLAKHGYVAITVDYRVASRHQVKPTECVADAKSAIRYVRSHAKVLGILPNKIVAAGGSAGGHLAASTALLPGLDDPKDDKNVSSVPNAVVMFNPAVIIAPVVDFNEKTFGGNRDAKSLGCEPKAISPFHHVGKNLPPMIIFHGKGDTTVPYRTVELFQEEMKKFPGNRCELVGYEGQPHGFFNYGRNENKYYEDTTQKMLKFLETLEK
ncbi:MAG: alpha/beta hydrolase [Zavarzinella sp.]